jgi:hypothetical protein
MRKLLWVIAATVIGMAYADFARSLRARRKRHERKEELVRWEGEGGNVPDV